MVERGQTALINSGHRRGGPNSIVRKEMPAALILRPYLSSMTLIHDVLEGILKGVEKLTWKPIHTFCLCNTEQLEEFTAYIIRLNQGTTCNDARPERTKPSRRSIAVLVAGTVAASSSAPCGGERLFLLGRSHRKSFPAGDDEDGEQASAPPMTVQWPEGQGGLGRGWRAADSLDGSHVPSNHVESGSRTELVEYLHGLEEGLHCQVLTSTWITLHGSVECLQGRMRGILHGSEPGLCMDRSWDSAWIRAGT